MRLTQLVTNLLTNAARFTPPRGRIALDIRAVGGTAIIEVTDTGIGISDELMPHIFEIFSQGPRELARTERGLGIGLPLVRRIAQLHGGEVEASSAGKGRGSTFRATLPRLEDVPVAKRSRKKEAEPIQRASHRILIVDDLKDAAFALETLLAARGHEVRTAGDAEAALEIAVAFAPEIALLDLGLPEMDGYQLASRLREMYPKAMLVAVTGYQRDQNRLEAAGFQHHLTKPIDLERLASLLAKRSHI